MGLGRRTFAAGEVLTSSNVMNYLMDQSVMNFAGTAARGSAIGTAVAEGMVSYINDTDRLEVYRAIGTAAPGWNPVAFESYVDAKPVSGLVPVIPTSVSTNAGSSSFNSTTGEISFSGNNTLNVNGVFTSAYKNYRILLEAQSTPSGTDVYLQLKNSSGTLAANYGYWNISVFTNGAVGGGYAAQTRFTISRSQGTNGMFSTTDLNNPGNTLVKRHHSVSQDSAFYRISAGNNATATAYTDVVISSDSNFTTATLKVYGYN